MLTKRTYAVTFLAIVLVAFTRLASAEDLSHVIVYGDSLSDNGNLYARIGYPPVPYWRGRASNGPVAVEYLSRSLKLPLLDFAWFGATSGSGNDVDGGTQTSRGSAGLPGMLTELAASKSSITPIASNTLFIVWGGANDFLTNGFSAATAQVAVSDLVSMVEQLQSVGATHIVVLGMPDIGQTPDYLGNGAATALSVYFNQLLRAQLPQGATYFDTFRLMHNVVAHHSAYGLTDVTDPCFNGVTVCANPDQYLFWDGFHPTTHGHKIVAAAIEEAAVPEVELADAR